MEIQGSACIVTGASSGIGRATAVELARAGGVVACVARRADRLDETLAAVDAHAPGSIAIACDVAESRQVEAMTEEVLARLGRVDVLVANAGVGRFASYAEETIDSIDRQVKINVLGQMYCAKAVLPHLMGQRRGHLVFVSSTNARIPPPMQAVYSATKAANMVFGLSLAYELEPFGIGVTIVYPGPIETEFFDAPEFARMRVPKKLPAERVGRAIVRGIRENKLDVSVPASLRLPGKFHALIPGLVRKGVRSYAKTSIPRP